MPELSETLLHLILNSVSLNEILGGEGIEILLGRVSELSADKQDELIKLFKEEAESMQKISADRNNIVADFYKKLKAVKRQAKTEVRKEAEQVAAVSEQTEAENLLAGL